jgi:hypothetical protein
MDLKSSPDYKFINNLTAPDIYRNKLDILKSQMPQILDEFKKYYVFYNKNPSLNEYQQIYDNIKNNLQSLISQLFVIDNEIQMNVEQINKQLIILHNEINKEKNKNIKFNRHFNKLENKYNASHKLIDNYKTNYNIIYLNNWSLFVGSILSSFIIYKVYKQK